MVEPPVSALTHRRVLNIAVPVVLANATVPILGAVDTAVVGQLGLAAPIGAVGIGAIIITTIYWLFGFLRMGTAGMTAQAVGAGDHGEVCALLVRSLMIGFVGGVVLLLLQVPLFWAALQVAPASDEVEGLANAYLGIRIYSAPAAIALYGVTGWMIARERTKSVLMLQLFMNGLNIILDLVFVLQLGWGVEGVATATLIAEWAGLVLGLFLVRDAFLGDHWRNWAVAFDRVILRRMAVVNSDIMIRSILLEIAFVSFLFFAAAFDDVTLAANQVLIQFLHITAYALDGFAFAAEALVGQAIGARNRAALRRSIKLTSIWGLLIVTVMALGFAFGGEALLRVMTTAEDVRAEAGRYLPWMVAAPLVGVAAWMFDGIFIGATKTRDLRNMMFISTCIYGLAVAALMPPFGNHGLWGAMLVFFIARGVTLATRFPKLEASVG